LSFHFIAILTVFYISKSTDIKTTLLQTVASVLSVFNINVIIKLRFVELLRYLDLDHNDTADRGLSAQV